MVVHGVGLVPKAACFGEVEALLGGEQDLLFTECPGDSGGGDDSLEVIGSE